MDIGLQIKALLSEAELYRSQGLFTDAKNKYQAAAAKIQEIDTLKNKERLLKSISGKIKSLEKITDKVSTNTDSQVITEEGQNLIKNLFGKTDLEKAIALAKFGQVERALVELNSLLKVDEHRVVAGKHILKFKIITGSADDAIDQYKNWYTGDLFTTEQLKIVRSYLKSILKKEGVDISLPMPVEQGKEDDTVPAPDDIKPILVEPDGGEPILDLDITSIGITFTSGPQEGKMVEFDVNFQSGDMLSLIISKTDKGIIEALQNGDKLNDVQYYSPIAMFKGAAMVANKTQINAGPKQGDYCLDLKVTST